MKTKRRSRKTSSKILSVVLCLTILVSTYGGFFSGFGAAAGKVAEINVGGMSAGEVAVSKGAAQDERSADITVMTAAKATSGGEAAATDAVYTDIIPEYYDVDGSSIKVSTGSAEVLLDQAVTIDGVVTTRDIVKWEIGTITEDIETLSYTINVNDPKVYGIVNVAEQGMLSYTENSGTATHSPLIVQIDEIILSAKGMDDYYVIDQGESLNANNNGVSGVLTNDDTLNTLVDDSGDGQDSKSIVNGHIAGLDGDQAALKLEKYTAELVQGAKNGTVTLNPDGTFTYVPNSDLYNQPVVDFTVDPNGSSEYNYSGTAGWEDSFTYKLDTYGPGSEFTKYITTSQTIQTITPIYGPDLSLVVFEDMKQNGADVEGAAAIGGDLTITGSWTVANKLDFIQEHVLVVGGTITGQVINNGGWKIAQNEQWIRDYVAKLREVYTALSDKYASMAPDGDSARNQYWKPGVVLTADPNHTPGNPHVFYIDSSDTIGQVQFSGKFGDDPIIINIGGKNLNFNGGSWGGTSMYINGCDLTLTKQQDQVIWNFYEAETMTTNSIEHDGCIIAPHATWTANGGHTDGVVIVKSMIGAGGYEYHIGSNLNSVAGDITIDIVTGETTTETTEEILIKTTMETYEVSSKSVSVEEGLKSEEITVHIRVLPNLSELTAVKSADPADGSLVKKGQEIEYTIEVFNPCSVAVNNVVVKDSAPFGATITDANGGKIDGRNITFTIDSIKANSSATVSFTVTVDQAISGTGNLANTASITYTLPGQSEPDSNTTNTVNHAVLSAEKSSSVDASTILGAGDEITYTIAVTNNGTADAQNVQVVDTLPDGVTFKEGNVENNGSSVSATIASIGAGQTAYVSFTVIVNEIAEGSKVIANTAEVNGEPTNTVENITKYGTVVVKYVDTEGKELLPSESASGKTGSEYGPYTAKDIENYRLVEVTGEPTGTFTEGEIVVIFVYEKIPGHATVYYVDEAGNTLATPESINGWQGDEVTDLLKKDIERYEFVKTDAPTTILTEEGITITHIYKLIPDSSVPTVSKTASPANGSLVKAGETIIYTISVTNNKYEAMSNVVVTDTAPKGSTITDAGEGTVNGDTVSFVIASIEPGATATVSFTVTVDAVIEGTGNLSNTAYVTYRDRDASVDTTIPTNTTGHAVLTAEKTGGDAAFYGVGDVYTYYITVTNNGSAAATGIVVTDTVPAGTTLYNEKNATVDGSNLSWTIDRLEAGASKTLNFEVRVNDVADFVTYVNNTAYVNGEPTNTTETIVKKGTVDVHFVDEDGNPLADSLHYEGKPGTAHGTTDAITIYGYELKNTTGSSDGNFVDGNITITHVYTRLSGTVTIHYIDLGSGQDILPNATGSGWVGDAIESDQWTEITNYTYVNTVKPVEMVFINGNVDIIHYYTYIEADDTPLDFVKSSNPVSGTTVNNGDEIEYIITLTNTRVDDVNNVVIEDYIPDGMTLVSASDGAEYSNGKLTWNVGTIAVGGKATVYFTAKVNDELSGYGNLRNVASATYANRDLEPEGPIYTNEVVHPILDAKLESFTNQPDGNLTEGDEIIYKITVTNEGSTVINNVPVSADIPEGTTFVSSEDGVSDGDNFITTIPSLEPGETVELYYTVEIDRLPDGVYEIDIPNIAVVDGENTNDVLDKAYVGILIVKYLDHDGSELTETTTTRARVGTAYGSLPVLDFANRQFDYVDGARIGSYIKGTITVVFWYKLIPATLTVHYVDKDTGEEIKTVDVYTGFNQGDAIPGTYAEEYPIDGYIYDSVKTPDPMQFVTPSADITHYYVRVLDTDAPTVEKTANPASGELVKAGDTITYTIAVTNIRETDALENVVVTDPVPAGTTVTAIGNDGTEENGVVTWTIGSIAAGQTKFVSFTVAVNEGLTSGSNLGNVAKVKYTDVQVGEDKEIPTNPTSHALLTSSKTSSVAEGTALYVGDIITYTVKVTNIGTAAANDITIYDTVPNGTGMILNSLTSGATYNEGKITYVVKDLQPGETATLTFSVQLSALADGEYAKTISNTAVVDGDPTNTTDNIVKRGTLTVKYQDTAGNTLHEDIVTEGAVDTAFTLPAEKSFEKLQLKEVKFDSDSKTYIEGNITYIYIYERIPAVATVKYLDYNSKATLLESKSFNGYVGDILDSDYYENITHYNWVLTDKPSTLEFTEEGLVIIHYYEYVFDSATIDRTKVSNPASGSLVKIGDEITYTINVTNPRYDAINDVVVTDAVPAGSTFVSADNNGTVSNGTVAWNLGTLESGASVAVSFTVKVDESFNADSNLYNIAYITFTGAGDAEPTTVPTNETRHAVLTYEKAVDTTATSPSNVLTYTITVKNEGSVKAENIVVTDNVPTNTTIVENSIGNAEYYNGGLTWNINKLEAGEEIVLTFQVTINEMDADEYREVVCNKAKVNGSETNEVETVVTQGAVVVSHIATDGTVLKPTETVVGPVGSSYTFIKVDSDVYELKEIECDDADDVDDGEVNGAYIEGTKYVKFIYEKREAGLVVKYLEAGTNKTLADTYTATYEVNDKVEGNFYKDIDLYEHVDTTYNPDKTLVMTKDGIEIIHYYRLIPTGDVVVNYVDINGNEIAESTTSSGNIYTEYSVKPIVIEGYDFDHVDPASDPESGKYPADATNTITYVYTRSTGTLVVRYLELETNKMLAQNVTEVYNTGDTVTNLHYKDIDLYEFNSSEIPEDLVMTKDGIEIIYYYTLIPTGTATAHYVDTEGNELLPNIDKAGNVYETYTFNEAEIDGWNLIKVDGAETGNFPADAHNDVYYIYERATGALTVYYLEEDTNATLSQAYNEVVETGTVVTDLHERDIDLYELVRSEIPADLTMTPAGLTITYWYRLIPTGDAVAKFVDTEGNTLAADITAAGNVYETYDFNAINIPGYKLISVEGIEEGNFPANATNEVIYTYERCVGVLTVNYLEKDTNIILAAQYTETVPTLVEVTDLHEKTIAYYNLVGSEIPEDLVMTEEGIVINYYYAQEATGSVTAHYVDEDYNPLLVPETVNGIVDSEYTFNVAGIDGYEFIRVEGDPAGKIAEEHKDVYFIYTREQGVLTVQYLEEGTDKVLADMYTETMDLDVEVEDLRVRSIADYVRTSTEKPDSLVMTKDGIDIIHYYKAIPMGKVIASWVDEEGNELLDSESMSDFVDAEYEYKPAEIPGYELIEVEGNPEGTITEEDQEVKFIYRRLNGTLHITYVDSTTGEQISESYNEVFNVFDVVEDLKEQEIDGYTMTDSEIPEDLTMTTEGLDVVYYYTPDTYKVSGTVWVDGNENSVYDKGADQSLSGIKAVLYDSNKTIVGTDLTDTSGNFEIDGVKAGKYTVSFDVPSKYSVVDSLGYSTTQTNSIADYTGRTGVLTVSGDTPNVGMGLEGIVLGSTATNEKEAVEEYKQQVPTQIVYAPTPTTQKEATYTKVLGDTGVNPSTGDTTESNGDLTVIAVMLVSCSLFVLTLAKKKGSSVAHRR